MVAMAERYGADGEHRNWGGGCPYLYSLQGTMLGLKLAFGMMLM
jgi:hypothetical protein